MRAKWLGAISFVLLALLVAFYSWQIWIVAVQPKRETNYHRANTSANQIVKPKFPDERIADYTEALAIFTALLAAVSVVQIWFLIRTDKTARISAETAQATVQTAKEQAGHMKSSLDIANATAKATAVAAEAARANTQMLIDAERARLMIFIAESNLRQIDRIDSIDGLRPEQRLLDPIKLEIIFRNYGRTPAIVTLIAWTISTQKSDDTGWKGLRVFEPYDDAVIDGSGKSDAFEFAMTETLSVGTAREIRAERLPLCFYGRVSFSDIFGESYDGHFSFQYEAPKSDAGEGRMSLFMYHESKKKK